MADTIDLGLPRRVQDPVRVLRQQHVVHHHQPPVARLHRVAHDTSLRRGPDYTRTSGSLT